MGFLHMPAYTQTSSDNTVELISVDSFKEDKRLSCFQIHSAGGNHCVESFLLGLQM